MDANDVGRAMRQYRDWKVVEVLDEVAEDGQEIVRIQSPDGTQETLVTSRVVLFGLDDEDDDPSKEGGR